MIGRIKTMFFRNSFSVACIASTLVLTACSKDEADSYIVVDEMADEVIVVEETAVPESDTAMLISSTVVVTTAVVEAIDYETRVVTLRPEGQEPVTITAAEQAHNLDQVEVGDTITAEYLQTLTVDIVPAEEGLELGTADVVVAGRSEKGETPAASVTESHVVVTRVEDINLENNTFKLKGPDGEVREYTARNPENLTLAKVGDAVVINMTEAVAFALTEKAGEAEVEAEAAAE
jgi:hypothetical protein